MFTKRIHFSALFIVFVSCFVSVEGLEYKTFLGSFEFPAQIKHVPSFEVLYKGTPYTVDVEQVQQKISRSAYFEIQDVQDYKELYILITQEIEIPKSTHFKYFRTSNNHSYKLFKLTRYSYIPSEAMNEDDPDGKKLESWRIQQIENGKKNIKIPDNTIMIMCDPKWIDRLEEVSWQPRDVVIRLPRFVFLPKVTQKDFDDIGSRMRLALMKILPFHTRRGKRIYQVANNHLVTMNYINAV